MNQNDEKRNQIAKSHGYKKYQDAVANLAVTYTMQSVCSVYGICYKTLTNIIESKGLKDKVSVIPRNKKLKLEGDVFEPEAASLEKLWYQARMEVRFLLSSEATRRNARKIFESYNFDRWGIYQGKVRKAFEILLAA